jgi:heat shock protein HslJ
MQCLEVKKGKKRELFYDTISGFEFVSGYNYRLLVKRETVENPPQDASKYQYTLLKILSKKSVSQTDLAGTKWTIGSLNGMSFASGSLEFSQNRIFAKFCNSISGTYSIQGNQFHSPLLASTLMYCEGDMMKLEYAFQLDQSQYLRVGDMLTITTKKGDMFIFNRKK